MDNWVLHLDSPESLNFAMYIGCSYGLLNNEKGENNLWPEKVKTLETDIFNVLQREWKVWWCKLIEERYCEIQNIQNRIFKKGMFNPPYSFSGDISILDKFCCEIYPSFFKWWEMPAGGKMGLHSFESMYSNMISKHIKKYEGQIGRNVNPFRLYIDLVYTGLNGPIEEYTDFIIITPLQLTKLDELWWFEKLYKIELN